MIHHIFVGPPLGKIDRPLFNALRSQGRGIAAHAALTTLILWRGPEGGPAGATTMVGAVHFIEQGLGGVFITAFWRRADAATDCSTAAAGSRARAQTGTSPVGAPAPRNATAGT